MTINTDRLSRLASMLDVYKNAPAGTPDFDLKNWSEPKFITAGHLWWKRTEECGTAACAVGLACLSLAFKDEGLTSLKMLSGHIVPVFGGDTSWEAVDAFFGLTKKQSTRLFQNDSYAISRGPQAAIAVAARIRALVQRSHAARKTKPEPRTAAAVAKIKAAALEPA